MPFLTEPTSDGLKKFAGNSNFARPRADAVVSPLEVPPARLRLAEPRDHVVSEFSRDGLYG